MRRRMIWIAPLAMLGMAAFIALGGYIVQQLWNWLLPTLFGFHAITFWQALGVLILCRILFGGFRLAGGGRGPGRRMRERMQQRAAERWDRMTPEERERARQRWCGWTPPDTRETR